LVPILQIYLGFYRRCLWFESLLGSWLSILEMFIVLQCSGAKPNGRPRRRWEVNIRMDLQETGWIGAAWTGLVWFRIERDTWRTTEELLASQKYSDTWG
jgi:hypothetical protein